MLKSGLYRPGACESELNQSYQNRRRGSQFLAGKFRLVLSVLAKTPWARSSGKPSIRFALASAYEGLKSNRVAGILTGSSPLPTQVQGAPACASFPTQSQNVLLFREIK